MKTTAKLLVLLCAAAAAAYLLRRAFVRWYLHQRLLDRLAFAARHADVRAPELVSDTTVPYAASNGSVILYNPE